MLRTDRRFNLGDLDFRSPSIADDEPSETLTTSFTDESLSDDVFSDEDFLDIEEILHDLSDYDPLDYQFLEREAGENSANDHRQTHSEASRNRNCLGAIRRMSGCRTTADGDAAETDQDAGDEGTLRHRQDVGDGMIELSHFHGLQAIPSSETGIAVVSEAAEARTNDATLLKTDRPCAKYQAFELASRPH